MVGHVNINLDGPRFQSTPGLYFTWKEFGNIGGGLSRGGGGGGAINDISSASSLSVN